MRALTTIALGLVFTLTASAIHAQASSSSQPSMPSAADVQQRVATVDDINVLVNTAKRFESESAWQNAAIVWRRITTLSPHNPHYLYSLAVDYALADDKAQAYNVLLAVQRSGAAYDLMGEPRFSNLHGTEVWDYLVELHKSALNEPFGEGAVAFELPPADLLLESIAHEPKSGDFLFGSARDGTIYRRAGNGKLTAWSKPQGDAWWSIFDIKIDAKRRHLWATTAAVPHFKGYASDMAGRSALLKIDLDNGKLIAAYPAPADGLPHILNTIALSSKGLVIVAEGLRGQLFKLEGDVLQPLMAERKLNALRGMVFSPDDKILYFADYERGLFGLELARSTAFDVAYPDNSILYGIEGLYMYEGQLVAIQNGIRPERVMRFKLGEDGHAIEMGVPVESANPAFATPTLGTLVDNHLYYIANSQRSYYDSYGLRKGSRELPPVKVFKTDVRFNWDFKPPSLPASLAPKVPGSTKGEGQD